MTSMWDELRAEFPRSELKFLPGATGQGQALALVYVDARAFMDRLDTVCKPEGWHDSYVVLPDGSVECTISIRCNEGWIGKSDCGYPNGSNDSEPFKGAYSDALKRACVRWGIGRYLYSFPQEWLPYDAQRKRFKLTNEEMAARILGGHMLETAKAMGAKPMCEEHGVEWVENKETKKRGHLIAGTTKYHVEDIPNG